MTGIAGLALTFTKTVRYLVSVNWMAYKICRFSYNCDKYDCFRIVICFLFCFTLGIVRELPHSNVVIALHTMCGLIATKSIHV